MKVFDMIRTQIQVYEEQLRWLKRQALAHGVSMSQVIRDCVDHYRTSIEHTRNLRIQKEKALAAVGSFSSETGKK